MFLRILPAVFCIFLAIPSYPQIPAPAREVPLVVLAGTPLRIALAARVSVKGAGTPVSGRIVESVYAFDKVVIPAGSAVSGRIKTLKPMSGRKRTRAIMAGDFTPVREPEVEFDTVILQNGTRLPIHTEVSLGARYPIQLQAAVSKGQKKGSTVTILIDRAKQEITTRTRSAIDVIQEPGKWERLKEMAWSRSPYRPQWLSAGTRYNAELLEPLSFGSETVSSAQLSQVGSMPPPGSVVRANLITPLDSATVQKGTPIEAVLTEPLFTADRHLVFPEGSRLRGTVVTAQRSRYWHRNGQLRFTFQRIEPPTNALPESAVMTTPAREDVTPPDHPQTALKTRSEAAMPIEGSLEGAETTRGAHLKIDSEGGTQVSESKWRYAAPAISLLLATSALHQETEKSGKIEDNGTGEAASGGVGFGLIGAGLGLTSRYVGAGLGFYGAGWSIYSRFIARGKEVVFPKDSSVTIRFGSHGGPANAAAQSQ